MGGGGSENSSKPLSAGERNKIYDAAISRIGNTIASGGIGGQTFASYQRPDYVDPGRAAMLSGGDYDALEKSIYDSATAGLSRFENLERERVNQDAADRGIWSSGLAMRAQGDVSERLAAEYARAGADATTQRYNLQAQELAGLNNYNLQSAGAANTFNQGNAASEYESKWRPLDYLAGIYGQANGTVSSGSSSQWSI